MSLHQRCPGICVLLHPGRSLLSLTYFTSAHGVLWVGAGGVQDHTCGHPMEESRQIGSNAIMGPQAEQTTVATDMSALQSFRRAGERHGMTV